ncbi:MAG: type II methionyl aminopeptidase [Nanoarchaeota archaeon]
MEIDKLKVLKAGKIASEVKKYAKAIIKTGAPLLEIAEKIEAKIEELGGKPAFPVNLSINDIAAHYTPSYDDKTLASGLLKVDLGVHIDGWVADTAFSMDLENNEENKRLILVSEDALKIASKTIKFKIKNNEIGKMIEESISSGEISPIINLSGHGIDKYELHSGITIPNIDNGQEIPLKEGLYAIEPFATNGAGKVYDGKDSGIYEMVSERNIRSQGAREVLDFIIKEYKTLPFCSRWLHKKLGAKSLLVLKQLEANGNLHQFALLMESGHGKVAQTENTFLVTDKEVIVTSQ